MGWPWPWPWDCGLGLGLDSVWPWPWSVGLGLECSGLVNITAVYVCLPVYRYVCLCTGASDDAVSCSMMLEVLHVMSRDSSAYQHCVVFIFNGAEENVVQVYFDNEQ